MVATNEPVSKLIDTARRRGVIGATLLVGVVAWFYRTVAYCKDQGLLVRVGE